MEVNKKYILTVILILAFAVKINAQELRQQNFRIKRAKDFAQVLLNAKTSNKKQETDIPDPPENNEVSNEINRVTEELAKTLLAQKELANCA